jgi:hypothetical protein
MKVDIDIELKASAPFRQAFEAACEDLKSCTGSSRARHSPASPSLCAGTSGTWSGHRVPELFGWLSQFSARHPTVVVTVAYEMDLMNTAGGHFILQGGHQLTHFYDEICV